MEGNSPWIDVIVDPDWKKTELIEKRRITGNIPLTPVYNLVLRIKPNFNTYCIDGREVEAKDLPASIPIKGYILIGEGKNITEIAIGSFLPNKVKDSERGFVYEWKLKGWPNGIASADKLEKLVAAIAAGKTVTTALDITKKDGTIIRQTSSASFSTCAPVWGNGKHNFVTMRGKASQLQADTLVDKTEKNRAEFGYVDPFKQNQSHFSYNVDLTLHDDSSWLKILLNQSTKSFRDLFDNKIPQASSCKGSKLYILYTNGIKINGSTGINKDKTIEGLTEPNVHSTMITSHSLAPSWTAVHEAGHAFAGLVDEDARIGAIYASSFPSLKTNCSINPSIDYLFNEKLYGDTKWVGCIAKNLVEKAGLQLRIKATLYRPSQGSLMNATLNTLKFNVVSCGYVMAAINSEPTDKEHAEKYWPACEDRLGTDRVAQSLRTKQLIPFQNLLAAVGSVLPETSTQSEDSSEEFLFVDNFTEKWSEFIQVLPDEETATVENLNLSVTKPTISGLPGNAPNTFYAGQMTLTSSIINQGGDISQTFSNMIQYRDASANGTWTDWVKFEVAGLVKGSKTDVKHTWIAGAGKWEFRLVAGGGNTISESISLTILPRPGAVIPSVPPISSGTPKLSLTTPIISGRQAGAGKIYAGSMTISEKVTNTGVGSAPPFQISLLYSQDGVNWSDWVSLDSLKLAPGAERNMIYKWNGDAGKWHFKACEDIKDTCSPSVSVEVI